MLGHASVQQTQRYLNVTDEELRRGLEVSWNNNGRPLRFCIGELIGPVSLTVCLQNVFGASEKWLRGRDLNPRPLGYEPNSIILLGGAPDHSRPFP